MLIRRFLRATALGAAAAGLAAPAAIAQEAPPASPPRDANRADEPPRKAETGRWPYDPTQSTRTIAFWEARAARDPKGAIARKELAGAYLARHRETGAIGDAVRAEKAARESLAIVPNAANTIARLARCLLAQHRFPEALELADVAARANPDSNRLRADALLELGDYEAAARALALVPDQPDDPTLLSLRARFAEVDGQDDRALELLRKGAAIADTMPDLAPETAAWYHAMIGHALVDRGRLDEAESACRQALAIFPADYRALTALAEAASFREDWKGAIAWGEKAIQAAPEGPEPIRLVGEAQAALGNRAEADRQFARLKALAGSFPRIYDRHWALFLIDHDRDLDEALALARKDLELRKDVHAYDTLAAACLKKGLLDEADAAIRRALARGTKDAQIFRHASLIAEARGEADSARRFAEQSRAINRYLSPEKAAAR